MSKRFTSLDGRQLAELAAAGSRYLERRASAVNQLNVFPVPDGDTGTNMRMTLSAGVKELLSRPDERFGVAAAALADGMLLGARGNSGVILSQLFSGFAEYTRDLAAIDGRQLAEALQRGVETAYQTVVKPVEGTILTVARVAAEQGVQAANGALPIDVLEEVICAAAVALKETPNQLPILKKAGVVDAGGQGLLFIYEGFMQALRGEPMESVETAEYVESAKSGVTADQADPEPDVAPPGHYPVQAMVSVEEIQYGYCTEFIIKLAPPGKKRAFAQDELRETLSSLGDSLLVAVANDKVKVHVHAELPGEALNAAMTYGDLIHIKIENMREQYARIIETAADHNRSDKPDEPEQAGEPQECGIVTVAAGEGIRDALLQQGADVVIFGGQTMNPSAQDFVDAIHRVRAKTVFLLPNNDNVIMAARQAAQLAGDKQVVTIPSATIPQGIAAVLAYQAGLQAEANLAAMTKAIGGVRSGQITRAVRNSSIDDVNVRQGDYIGIADKQLVAAAPDLAEACCGLLKHMLAEGGDLVGIYCGEGATDEATAMARQWLSDNYAELEMDIFLGGQPVYSYLISVE
jgi:DAK2 domain fusion protein YloV